MLPQSFRSMALGIVQEGIIFFRIESLGPLKGAGWTVMKM